VSTPVTPGSHPALIDQGNPLFGPAACQLDTGVLSPGNGTKVGVLTIRTPTTTLTVMLAGPELGRWAQAISGLADQVSGTGPGLALPSPADISAVSTLARERR